MAILYSIEVLNLWFMHFSWGKIWFDIFPPCKQNYILQLWTDSRLTSYWVSTDSSDSQLTFYWYSFDLKIILLNISSIAKSKKSISDLSVSLVIEIFLCCIRQLELISKYLQWLHLIRYLQFVFYVFFKIEISSSLIFAMFTLSL